MRSTLSWSILLVLLSFCSTPFNNARGDEPQQLRVLCYNIHHSRGLDEQVDLERIAKVIRNCKPDLVALQEVDNQTKRTGGVDQTAELARRTGLTGTFVKQIDFEGGEYGQALLSRTPIENLDIVWLPGEPVREQRIVGIGQFQIHGRKLRFCTTHLHHINGEFRLRQVQEINRELTSSADLLTIIAGDLNAEPTSAPIRELAKSWTVAGEGQALNTFPTATPTKQIDYIAFRPQSALQLRAIEVIDEPMASDHRPLLAIFDLAQTEKSKVTQ